MSTDLTAIRQRAEAATPGPWTEEWETEGGGWESLTRYRHPRGVQNASKEWILRFDDDYGTGDAQARDAAYIAVVSPDVVLTLLDRIEALERALVTARAALADVQEHLEQSSIDPGRFTYLAGIQQALAEIARVGVTGAEPCTEHDWSVDVVKDAAGHWQADALKDRLIECRRCGITASEVAP